MSSFASESPACESEDVMCNLRGEVLSVLFEACLAIVAICLGSMLWKRFLCKKVPTFKGAAAGGASPQRGRQVRSSRCQSERNHGTVVPDGSTPMFKFHVLFRSYAASQDVNGILRTLDAMVKQGLHPDNHVFDAALGRFPTNSSDVDPSASIQRIFEALVKAGFTPSNASLSAVVQLLLEAEDYEATLLFLQSMRQRFDVMPDPNQYAKLGWACKSAGSQAAAVEVYKAMLKDLGEESINSGVHSRRFCDWIKTQKTLATVRSRPAATITDAPRGNAAEQAETLQFRRLVTQFLFANGLERAAVEKVPDAHMRWIMYENFTLKDDVCTNGCSSVHELLLKYLAEAAQKPNDFWKTYPTANDLQQRLTRYIALNDLDARCTEMLGSLPSALAQKVLDHEFHVRVDAARGTASAKVVGHILRYRRQSASESP